jgi:hypothetical protein
MLDWLVFRMGVATIRILILNAEIGMSSCILVCIILFLFNEPHARNLAMAFFQLASWDKQISRLPRLLQLT